ncbi:MAG: flavodoxin family protein [Lachnospiraceae bacterium]|jgi:multimeric flavodoxin WrbA|nr:flavodoxin family protein [Lachnospiraceae bacterium]
MSKRVLVISTSLRSDSNSEALADAFMEGAKEAGHQIQKINLRDKTIGFCKGCLACLKKGNCVIPDDAVEIAEKMHDAEVIAFATPIYYYEMSGQMKTMLDRANSLYGSDYAFQDIYLLSTAAEDEEGVDRRAVSGLEGWIACFERARLAGTVFVGGVNAAGEITGHPGIKQAYEAGRAV